MNVTSFKCIVKILSKKMHLYKDYYVKSRFLKYLLGMLYELCISTKKKSFRKLISERLM